MSTEENAVHLIRCAACVIVECLEERVGAHIQVLVDGEVVMLQLRSELLTIVIVGHEVVVLYQIGGLVPPWIQLCIYIFQRHWLSKLLVDVVRNCGCSCSLECVIGAVNLILSLLFLIHNYY